MKYLCVAEKNDAAKNIAAILSHGRSTRREGLSKYNKIYEFHMQFRGQDCTFTMTSVSGHLLNYGFDSQFKGWHSCNPIELFQAPIRKVCPDDYKKIKQTLEREIRSCVGLIIWTDCDREGENIGFEVLEVCRNVKANLEVLRAKFSEITPRSLQIAMGNLQGPDKNVSDAVDVRSELDLRTGAAFTRLQTLRLQKVFPVALSQKLISYGSCQFPTLGFVVERYNSVQNFVPEPFWRINMSHTVKKITTDFQWDRDRLFNKRYVEGLLAQCAERNLAQVLEVTNKPKSKWRPLPLDTTEMEKIISRKLRINAKEVMKIAETLYTQGLISYPRTETNVFPKGIDLAALVEAQRPNAEWGAFAQRILTDFGGPNPRQGKKSDQAHPPIHPLKLADNLAGNQKRVYEYIVRHFLACVSADAKGHETIVKCKVDEERFTAKGLVILERNYLDVYVYETWNAKEINEYREGDEFVPTVLALHDGSTSAPKLLTEADLIALMEKHGIGTDATHAEHIETIKAREYVQMQQQIYFVPTPLGGGLIEGYNRMELELSLAKPNLRSDFEADLKLICEGRKRAEEVRTDQIRKYREAFIKVEAKMLSLDRSLADALNDEPQPYQDPGGGGDGGGGVDGGARASSNNLRPVLKCPMCGGGSLYVRRRTTSAGWYLGCSNFPECKNAAWFSIGIEDVEVTESSCEICGPNVKKLKVHFRQNPFLGEPNPNILCVGGCDQAVLAAFDIPRSKVQKLTNQTANNRPPQPMATLVTRVAANDAPPIRNSRNGSNGGRDTGSTVGIGGGANDEDRAIICQCNETAKLLTCRKEGPNTGRQFYKCSTDRCRFFLWATATNTLATTNTSNSTGGGGGGNRYYNGNNNGGAGSSSNKRNNTNNGGYNNSNTKKRKTNASSDGTSAKKCSVCRQTGHNKLKCPNRG